MKKIITAVLLTFVAGVALAVKPIEIVVPYAPGGAADANARALSQILEQNKIENIVTYHPGADGDIGYRHTMDLKNNVLMLGAHANLVFSHVVQDRPNHMADTLTIIGPTMKAAQGFLTSPAGFQTYSELIAVAKKEELPCGTGSSTGTSELQRFNKEFKTKFVPVPYKGSAPMAQDLGGNHLKCAFDTLASHYTRHEARQLKILSTSFAHRVDVPLVSTQLPIDKSESWYAFAIPKGSNLENDKRLVDIIKNFSSNTKILQTLMDQGFVPAKINPDINNDIRRQTEMYRSLKR